jgi:hypothetical protein
MQVYVFEYRHSADAAMGAAAAARRRAHRAARLGRGALRRRAPPRARRHAAPRVGSRAQRASVAAEIVGQ